MKRFLIITLAVLLTFGAVAQTRTRQAAPPQGGPGGPGNAAIPGFGPDRNVLADYLGLTAGQQASWETIQNELRTSTQALHEQQRTLGEQLRAAIEAGTDAAAIGNLVLQVRAIDEQLEAAREAAEARFAATLTAEQRVKFEALLAAAEYLRANAPGRH